MQATQKIVNLGLLISAGALYLFLAKLLHFVWTLTSLPRMTDLLIRPPDAIGFALVVGGVIYVRRKEDANRFLNEAVSELSKVTWPDRKETVVSTGISCILVAICALILLGFDSLWGTILKGVFRL